MLSRAPDAIAPDGSEIRFVQATARGSVVHCTLPPGAVTVAVQHRTVEEIWFFLGGVGEVWRRDETAETVLAVGPGASLTIPVGSSFQFRTVGDGAVDLPDRDDAAMAGRRRSGAGRWALGAVIPAASGSDSRGIPKVLMP